jgi:hypothetical protein
MLTRDCATLAAALALSLAAGIGHAASPPQRLSVGERMVVVRLPDGTLMGCVHRVVDGLHEAAARYSKDNGLTWSEPETLLTVREGMGVTEMLCDRDGEVHLFLLDEAGTGAVTQGEAERVLHNELIGRRLDIWYARSHDGRTRWDEPRMVWMGYTGALNSVIQMNNGRILLPFSWWTPRNWRNRGGGLKEFTFMGQFDSTLIYSDDGGATWALANNLSVPVPDIVSAYGAVEPVVIQLKDGRVWMLIRAQTGRFWESFSDDGARWSEPQPTSIISSDSPAGSCALTTGGWCSSGTTACGSRTRTAGGRCCTRPSPTTRGRPGAGTARSRATPSATTRRHQAGTSGPLTPSRPPSTMARSSTAPARGRGASC